MTLARLLRLLPWLVLAFIAYATLSSLALRPQLGSATLERFGAFWLLGLLFALAYPRRLAIILLLVAAAALGLELSQMLAWDRHGRMADALVKLGGGYLGIASGWLALRLWPGPQNRLGAKAPPN